MRIKTITTEYVLDEDRIRLSVADPDDHKRTLWLTRRLSERIIPACLNRLPLDAGSPEEVPAAQVYAQLEARLYKKPAPTVQPDKDQPEFLITQVKMNRNDSGTYTLSFDDAQGESAVLVLSAQEMRQWLEVLKLAFVKGEWRMDIWPAWLTEVRQG